MREPSSKNVAGLEESGQKQRGRPTGWAQFNYFLRFRVVQRSSISQLPTERVCDHFSVYKVCAVASMFWVQLFGFRPDCKAQRNKREYLYFIFLMILNFLIKLFLPEW